MIRRGPIMSSASFVCSMMLLPRILPISSAHLRLHRCSLSTVASTLHRFLSPHHSTTPISIRQYSSPTSGIIPRPSRVIHNLNVTDNQGAKKKAKVVGRGMGSGLGKTSGRGHKGWKARSSGFFYLKLL